MAAATVMTHNGLWPAFTTAAALRSPRAAIAPLTIRTTRGAFRTAGPATHCTWANHCLLGLGAASCMAGRRVSRSFMNRRRAARIAVQAAGEPQSEVSEIAFMVGEIVSAEKHPESEKLLVEQIDIGEGAPRTICSGIAKWFSPDEVVGKRVVVVANLGDRKMGGVSSEGMLLCAKAAEKKEGEEGEAKSSEETKADAEEEDKGELVIVKAPDGAAVGERVVIEVEGETHGDSASQNRVRKKKLYDKVAPFLNTDADGTVCYKASPFNTSAGPCTALPILSGIVS